MTKDARLKCHLEYVKGGKAIAISTTTQVESTTLNRAHSNQEIILFYI